MREPAGGSAAAGVRGVAPLSDGTSQFRGGTRGRYSQAWGWRMWYLGEVVCPVMAGAGQRNVMEEVAKEVGRTKLDITVQR